jgi:hypothetical protein
VRPEPTAESAVLHALCLSILHYMLRGACLHASSQTRESCVRQQAAVQHVEEKANWVHTLLHIRMQTRMQGCACLPTSNLMPAAQQTLSV